MGAEAIASNEQYEPTEPRSRPFGAIGIRKRSTALPILGRAR